MGLLDLVDLERRPLQEALVLRLLPALQLLRLHLGVPPGLTDRPFRLGLLDLVDLERRLLRKGLALRLVPALQLLRLHLVAPLAPLHRKVLRGLWLPAVPAGPARRLLRK
jgi:hypothetical protein